MDRKYRKKLLKDTVAALAEHFDTVQIFCTLHDGNTETTFPFQRGCGNAFAREGQVADWLAVQQSINIDLDDPKWEEDDSNEDGEEVGPDA